MLASRMDCRIKSGNDGEVRMIAARYLCSIASTARIVGK
jgi:hypothetical protein